jgi:precorrin-2 dehydrogenase/sirohydrochlorin ferrochelatase
MFPLVLNLDGRLSVVVGGGPVGRRKAAAVLAAGGNARLVCLEPKPHDEHAPALTWLTEPYRPSHLDGASLVFAAATPRVNHRVVHDARQRGVWVNSADDPAACDFHVPAVVRRGPLTLAVNTGGAAPALAAELRQDLEQQFDDDFGRWVSLLAELRPVVLARVADPARRQAVFRRLCGRAFARRLAREGVDGVRRAMLAVIETLAEDRPSSL